MWLRTHTERPDSGPARKTTLKTLADRISWMFEGKELNNQIATLQSIFQEIWWKDRSRDRIKKAIKSGQLNSLIELEWKCPGMIKRLSKEYEWWDYVKLTPTYLDSIIKYARNKEVWAINLYPIKRLLEKENPTKDDEDKAIAYLNLIDDQNTFTMPEFIIKDWEFLLTAGTPENYKNYLRRTWHMGRTDCNSYAQFLIDHIDEVVKEAEKHGKSEREIQKLRGIVEKWKQNGGKSE